MRAHETVVEAVRRRLKMVARDRDTTAEGIALAQRRLDELKVQVALENEEVDALDAWLLSQGDG